MNKVTVRSVSLVLLLSAILLAACAPQSTAAPTAAPQATDESQAMQQTIDAIKTQAIVTANAVMTSEAFKNPSATPTAVPPTPTPTTAPTETAIVIPPTATQVPPTATPTMIYPTITLAPPPYQCTIKSISPAYGKSFSPEDDFDGRWVLLNSGSEIWDQDSIDVYYKSGEKMFKFDDLYDLPSTVRPGESITIIVDMKAPKTAGSYTTTWGLSNAGSGFCTFSVSINVK